MATAEAAGGDWVQAMYYNADRDGLVPIEGLSCAKTGKFRWATGPIFTRSAEKRPRCGARSGLGPRNKTYYLDFIMLCTFTGMSPGPRQPKAVYKDGNSQNVKLANLEWSNS